MAVGADFREWAQRNSRCSRDAPPASDQVVIIVGALKRVRANCRRRRHETEKSISETIRTRKSENIEKTRNKRRCVFEARKGLCLRWVVHHRGAPGASSRMGPWSYSHAAAIDSPCCRKAVKPIYHLEPLKRAGSAIAPKWTLLTKLSKRCALPVRSRLNKPKTKRKTHEPIPQTLHTAGLRYRVR